MWKSVTGIFEVRKLFQFKNDLVLTLYSIFLIINKMQYTIFNFRSLWFSGASHFDPVSQLLFSCSCSTFMKFYFFAKNSCHSNSWSSPFPLLTNFALIAYYWTPAASAMILQEATWMVRVKEEKGEWKDAERASLMGWRQELERSKKFIIKA